MCFQYREFCMSMVFKNVPSHIRASSSSDGVAVRPSGLTRPVGKMMEDSTVNQRPMRMTYPQIQGEKNPGGPCFIRLAGSPRPERCLTGVGNNFHVQLPPSRDTSTSIPLAPPLPTPIENHNPGASIPTVPPAYLITHWRWHLRFRIPNRPPTAPTAP